MTTRQPLRSPRTRGFTFAEIMFAVVILGIGFIMVAAMFPVAIRQTQTSLEELTGVAEAKRGAATMRQLGTAFAGYAQNYATSPNQFTNPAVSAFRNIVVTNQLQNPPYSSGSELYTFFTKPTAAAGVQAPYEYVKGDLINQLDPRFAWVPVAYQVDQQAVDNNGNPLAMDATGVLTVDPTTGAPQQDANGQNRVPVSRVLPQTARVWVVAVQKRDPENPRYTSVDRESGTRDLSTNASALLTYNGCFRPKITYFKLIEGEDPTGVAAYPDTILFTDVNGTPQDEPAAETGAYIWVASDRLVQSDKGNPQVPNYYQLGAANGRFYRLGTKDPELTGVWELQPGNDMAVKHNPGTNAIYGDVDDFYENENLPPRQVEPAASHPYFTRNYANVGGSLSNRPARGLMIGRGLKNPSQDYHPTNNPFVGGAQDVFALPPVSVTLRPQS